MGLFGYIATKAAVSVFGVANVVAGTLALSNPATAAAAPIFFGAAEAAIVEVVNPVGPISVAVAAATGPV